jgi:hypothetical protein
MTSACELLAITTVAAERRRICTNALVSYTATLAASENFIWHTMTSNDAAYGSKVVVTAMSGEPTMFEESRLQLCSDHSHR